jgi:amino acid adenylation domain-containing protein
VPKGVAIQHRSAVSMVRWSHAMYGPEEYAGLLASTSICFDMSVFEIFATLAAGGKLLLAENALALPELAAKDEVVLVDTVPSAMAELLRLGGLPSSIRTVNLGGEALKGSLVREIHDKLPNVERVVNLYGPSEDTTFSTYAVVPRDSGHPLIGRPLTGESAYVLDGEMRPVPVGIPGALYLGGEGVSRGYLYRPDLTAERYVPNPYGPSGSRLYRVGDLVRYLPTGELDFLGRLDHQVKVRGFRIELGEIESALTRHEAVREAAVLAMPGASGGNRLIAYVETAGDLPPGELRSFLAASLPEYMVPSAFVLLRELPLTPNGKLDRRALSAMPAMLASENAADEAAVFLTPTEELVAGLFAEVLGVERVDAGTSFFALGGHSLLATQVVSRARRLFGIELPLRAIFEAPTVSGLGARIVAAGAGGRPSEVPPLARVERSGPLPLSFAQERLWFLDQLEPGTGTYNIPVTVELAGPLDVAALVSAFAEVVRRQESLRTTFVEIGGVPHQRIAPFSPAGLPRVDLSALPAAVAASEAERLGRDQEHRGFDLERGPLFRGLLVRLAGERHRFLLTFHHVISDGWSIGVLVRELGELYAAAVEGRPSLLPELPVQYADFAHWQRERLAGEQAAELAYWESRLGGEVAPVELPADRPRPAVQTFRGGRRQLVIPAGLTAQLKRFGREEGVTLFMTLLAATQALLSRQSGEQDVAVGAPVAGRQWTETEGLIGCFLNTLVLRTDLSGSPSFRELVSRVRTVTVEAYSNQTVPFEAVLAHLNLQRDLSRTPLFQVLFNMLNLPAADLSLPGLELRLLTPAEVPSKFDLTFYLAEADSRVWIDLVYNADLFDEARMADVLAQLELLLAQAVERPQQPVDHLSLVTAGARALLPDPTAPLDAGWIGGIHELFAMQADRAPDRPAVVDGEAVWSYGDLLAGTRGLAGWLAAHGVRPGDPVAIFAHRSAPLVQAVLGTLTAGAAFLILDPVYPAPRLAEMLVLAAPRGWIALQAAGPAPEAVEAWLEAAGCPRLELPAGGAAALESVAVFSGAAPWVSVGPGDAACLGFTSGSTGGPKGVLGLHGSLSHFLPAYCAEFELGPDDRFSLLSGLAHDPLQRDIFTPLFLGATIVVPDPADFGIAGRLAAWMDRERVTVASLTPSLGQLLTERPPGGEEVVVPSLRRAILIGEVLTRQDVARLRRMAPGVSCVNLYGATETQRALGFHRATREEAEAGPERARQVLPLGRGLQDAQLLVVNRAGRLCGIGEIGEVVMRSPHLAHGYLGDTALTAERFQVNPFTGEAWDRVYRTGDLGRYLPDGEVAFAGRADSQIKLRGFRIELGEIEGALARHPAVREAVVLLREDLPGGSGLVAYVAAAAAGAVTAGELHDHLWQRLPAYMVPSAFLFLESLPRTPTGKIDRRALARHAVEIPSAGGEPGALRTPVEEIVAGLWSEVLGLAGVGADDNFFQLGGHSLTGARVVSRLRQELQVDLPLRVLFEVPTVAGLAAEIERRRHQDGAAERPTIASFRQDRSAPPPLSFAQERFWAGRELEARSVASTIPIMVLFEGPLDLASLRRALQEIVERHEVLRTTFREDAERPVQIVHPTIPIQLRTVDLEPLAPADRMAEVRRWSILDGRSHFDFGRGPLFRLTLFRCAEVENVLLCTVHHIAFDGWSNSVLIGELSVLYNAFHEGRPSPLRPLGAQYQDFARWQRQTLAGESLEREVIFWREHLRGALPLDFGKVRPPVGRRTFKAGLEPFTLPEELARKLEAFAAEHCVTLFMTLLAAFKALLHYETGREDIVVTSLFANRNQVEIENLIGNFFAGLPLRTRLAGVRTFRDLLERVRDVTLAAHEHPDILYGPVMEGMGFLEEGDRGGLATFRVMFQFVKWPPAEQSLADLKVRRLPFDTGKINQDLTLVFSQTEGISGRFKYNRDVLDQERVAHMRDRLLEILSAVVADPDRPLAELAPEICVPEMAGETR